MTLYSLEKQELRALKKITIDFGLLSGKHNGVNIANGFFRILKDYNIVSKFLAITLENATNNNVFVQELAIKIRRRWMLVGIQNVFDFVLGYHLEWELSGEVVSCDTDKSKEPEKQKPIWQVPSKEVDLIFDGATKAGILDRNRKTGRCPWEQGLPTWPPESHQRKRTHIEELGTRERKTIMAPNAR
ncbi:hypothetical protein C2G38_2232486 [Gigaspora rosea]|uniref:Uncharacterized protein n=1 Tax=Gigaspora rosea TaxID=44941 RepID=A0A397TVI7_9GLOM|nr:hypothetical protein C2G38_2232486 [Gigaspora rosea]